ncbi:MAG: N-methyl-L-tryptophan oxidase [Gemmataceae bacterium]
MTRRLDVIVVGVGGMGSATCFELARRGLRVLGLEQFDLGHDRGSSHGLTRVIRKAYYEHPSYVPLVRRAYERWYDLEQLTGRHLLTECGCLNVGPPGGELVGGVRRSAAEHGLPVEELTGTEIGQRFPFRLPTEFVGVLEREAGFLFVEQCVAAHVEAARKLGAEIHNRERVVSWNSTGRGIDVQTERDRYTAAALVLTAGPWAAGLLERWGRRLSVMRQTMLWFGTSDDCLFRRDRFPIYLAEVPDGYFYGLPVIDGNGHKVARHYGAPELAAPDEIDRSADDADEAPVRAFLNRYLPAVDGPLRRAQVCTYTLTPDRHFVLDRHPEHGNVAIASGFSGHGFKFAPVVGEIMADLATDGKTRYPIEMFRMGRFA